MKKLQWNQSPRDDTRCEPVPWIVSSLSCAFPGPLHRHLMHSTGKPAPAFPCDARKKKGRLKAGPKDPYEGRLPLLRGGVSVSMATGAHRATGLCGDCGGNRDIGRRLR